MIAEGTESFIVLENGCPSGEKDTYFSTLQEAREHMHIMPKQEGVRYSIVSLQCMVSPEELGVACVPQEVTDEIFDIDVAAQAARDLVHGDRLQHNNRLEIERAVSGLEQAIHELRDYLSLGRVAG